MDISKRLTFIEGKIDLIISKMNNIENMFAKEKNVPKKISRNSKVIKRKLNLSENSRKRRKLDKEVIDLTKSEEKIEKVKKIESFPDEIELDFFMDMNRTPKEAQKPKKEEILSKDINSTEKEIFSFDETHDEKMEKKEKNEIILSSFFSQLKETDQSNEQKKNEREKMKGVCCKECEDFYQSLENDQLSTMSVQNFSRHRYNPKKKKSYSREENTPAGFWNGPLDFFGLSQPDPKDPSYPPSI